MRRVDREKDGGDSGRKILDPPPTVSKFHTLILVYSDLHVLLKNYEIPVLFKSLMGKIGSMCVDLCK